MNITREDHMKKATKVLIAAVLGTFAMSASGADVTVKPSRIEEDRVRQVIERKGVSMPGSGLKVQLRVDNLSGASSFGKVKILKAVDDAGTDLVPKNPSAFADDFEPIEKQKFFESDKRDPGFFVEVTLDLAPRKATKIALLKGEFQAMAGGKEQVVSVKAKAMLGKKLTDAALKEAGVEVTVAAAKAGQNELVLEVSGSESGIKKVEVLDGAGKSASDSNWTSGFGEKRTTQYGLKKPLDDSTTLKITVFTGQKAMTVPFEVKDLELP